MQSLNDHLVVFPDSPGGARAHRQIGSEAPQLVAHASGRPWLAGSWAPEDLVVSAAGPVRVAVFGPSPVTPDRLGSLVSSVRALPDLDALVRALPGNTHVVASVDGQVRFQGTVTGTRCVFTARLGDVPIAADRADVLAAATGAEPDEDLLATSVTYGMLFAPLSERSWWRGVHQVAADSCLVLPADGAARSVRWWQPPEPHLPLSQGAAGVRARLREAVAQRQPQQGRLSADLSGGMDSTSLCFLAAEHSPDLLTFCWTGGSAINDDPLYAGRAARLLTRAEHLTVPDTDAPPVFSPPYWAVDTEAPRAATRGMNAIRFDPAPGRARRHPAPGRARRGRAVHRGRRLPAHALPPPPGDRLAAVARPPGAALLAAAAQPGRTPARRRPRHLVAAVRRRPRPHRTPAPDSLPRLGRADPGDALGHPGAVRTTRAVFRAVADQVAPLAPDRGQHEALTALRSAGPVLRLLCREYTAEGLPLELPYLDDRVVEAVLEILPHERYDPWRYKPVLAAAMDGLVPEVILNRTTKGDCEEPVDRALREHVPDLLDLFADSLLARRGLIDVDRMRTTLITPPRTGDVWSAQLEATIGAELWLREIAARPTVPAALAGPAPGRVGRSRRTPESEETP